MGLIGIEMLRFAFGISFKHLLPFALTSSGHKSRTEIAIRKMGQGERIPSFANGAQIISNAVLEMCGSLAGLEPATYTHVMFCKVGRRTMNLTPHLSALNCHLK